MLWLRGAKTLNVIRVINFELVQPICPRYINVTDGQTDGRTDGRLSVGIPHFALHASRGNKTLRMQVEGLLKSINICQSYCKNKIGAFL